MRAMLDGEPMVQLLTPEGTRVDHPDYSFPAGDAGTELMRTMYRDMVLARRLDVEAAALQRHGELGLWPPSSGQEGAQIGAARALGDQDFVFPTYREHGMALVRGIDPVRILSLFRGTENGPWDTEKYRFGLYTIVIGAQTLHATGYAMGAQLDGLVATGDPERDMAVVAHFGDGASSQGDVNEAFVFAASYNAPVVFFCQNNQWAISIPTDRQTKVPLYQRAAGFGFPGVRIDGNDPLAAWAVTRAALDHARNGSGPVLIEAFTYRMGAHTTTDDPTRYRASDEVEEWRRRDPITRLATYLRAEDLADETFFAGIDDEAEALGEHMRSAVKQLAEPSILHQFDNVFAETTAELAAARDAYAAYLEQFEEAL